MVFQKGNNLYKKRRKYNGKDNPFYGKRHSEETKKKMGAKKGSTSSFKGKKHTKESILKMRKAKENYIPWNKDLQGAEYLDHFSAGKIWCDGLTKVTDERIAKYAIKLKGREFSEEHKKNISDSRWGKDNPAWNGGNSFYPYSPKFNRKLKKEIAERDDYTCQLCGEKNPVDPNVHHWNYDKLEVDSFYFVYTCRKCNAKLNYKRKQWEKYFYLHQVKRGLKR